MTPTDYLRIPFNSVDPTTQHNAQSVIYLPERLDTLGVTMPDEWVTRYDNALRVAEWAQTIHNDTAAASIVQTAAEAGTTPDDDDLTRAAVAAERSRIANQAQTASVVGLIEFVQGTGTELKMLLRPAFSAVLDDLRALATRFEPGTTAADLTLHKRFEDAGTWTDAVGDVMGRLCLIDAARATTEGSSFGGDMQPWKWRETPVLDEYGNLDVLPVYQDEAALNRWLDAVRNDDSLCLPTVNEARTRHDEWRTEERANLRQRMNAVAVGFSAYGGPVVQL